MKNIAWAAFKKTKKGRILYARKKHAFEWQRVANICYALINTDIPLNKRDRYYVGMRAGLLGYSYAMLRMYPGFAKSYLLSLAGSGKGANKDDEFAKQWKETTFAIIERGLDYLGQLSGLPEGYVDGAQQLAYQIGRKYWEFLDSLVE